MSLPEHQAGEERRLRRNSATNWCHSGTVDGAVPPVELDANSRTTPGMEPSRKGGLDWKQDPYPCGICRLCTIGNDRFSLPPQGVSSTAPEDTAEQNQEHGGARWEELGSHTLHRGGVGVLQGNPTSWGTLPAVPPSSLLKQWVPWLRSRLLVSAWTSPGLAAFWGVGARLISPHSVTLLLK